MLAIEVELLTGRYVATAYNTRLEAEWPPHPARLFSALVATHFADDAPRVEERALLERLEGFGAPEIHASDASQRDVVTVFVPVNDAGMADVDAEAEARDAAAVAVEAAQAGGDAKALKKAQTALGKAEARLAKAIDKATNDVRGNPATAAKVLPEGRGRQPRTFPSVTPASPRVTYVWPEGELDGATEDTLTGLLGRLVRLGHSSSLAAARVVDGVAVNEDSRHVWRPSPTGEAIFRGVQPGQLQALERAYALHRETEPRVMPARFEGYTRRSAKAVAEAPRSAFSDDWLVLRRVGGPALPMVATPAVARTLRRALMSYGGDPVPPVLSGHNAQGQPLGRDHLAIVPLPFVGHTQVKASMHSASGTLLGVALVLPRDVGEDERREVYRRVAVWEETARMEDEDTPKLTLLLGKAGELELERVEWGAVPASLRPNTWCHAARVWVTATPVALDRNPGELRSRDRKKLDAALAEAKATIRRACARIGLPDPERVEVLPAAPLTGAAKAKHYGPFPEGDGKLRRVLTHARLVFAEPVVGPILIGAGRYQGLGLFRPESLESNHG